MLPITAYGREHHANVIGCISQDRYDAQAEQRDPAR